MRDVYGIACALVALTESSAPAHAETRTHDGFYMQVTGGLGYYNVSSENDQSISGMTMPNFGLMLGGSATSHLVIGGGLFVDYSPSPTLESGGMSGDLPGGGAQMVVALGGFADYYLDPKTGGLHFGGFLGWGGLEETKGVGGSDPTGLVVAVSGGYEIWLSDEWSIGGVARLTYGKFSLNDVSANTISPALLATLTWH
jgi:hypothetical protein